MLTFRLLQVYRQVVDSGSITAASDQLALSQPTVSLQLKKLSKELDVSLFEIHHGKMLLTEAGKALYRCAQEVLSSQQKLHTQIEALRGVEVGTLKIAVVTTAKYVVPPLLADFVRSHPKLDIELKIGNRAQIIERLRQNMDDLYIFSHPPRDLNITCQPFDRNIISVIAPASYEGRDNCSLTEINDERFLMREQGSGTQLTIQQYCDRHQVELKNTMLVESNEAIKISVASGLGLAILSEHTLAQFDDTQIKRLNIKDFPLHAYWQAVTSNSRPKSLVCDAFLAFLEAQSGLNLVGENKIEHKELCNDS